MQTGIAPHILRTYSWRMLHTLEAVLIDMAKDAKRRG